MGLAQSTPAPTPEMEPPPGEATSAAMPARPTSPPHPSRSTLNPASTRRTGFSYFLPISTPDLQHSHLSPTLEDIRKTAVLLTARLPPELVTRILDEAEYWAGCRTLIQKDLVVAAGVPSPRRSVQNRWKTGQEKGDLAHLEDRQEGGEVWYLASEPVGCDETHQGVEAGQKCWVRSVVIETLSKDQGWSSAVNANPALYGTYDHSYSWFEVSLFRDGQEVEATRQSFQHNIHAGQYFKAHRNVLDADDSLVRQVRSGDRIVIWVRAQYPGWRNLVREAAITLYTAPFPLQT